MKIKQRISRHVVASCVIALLGLNVSTAAVADNELDASEIKKVRYLSRALLQGRALEKKRIETEMLPERIEIKKMEDSLGDLIAKIQTELMQVSLTPVNAAKTNTAVFTLQNSPSGSIANAIAVPVLSSESSSKLSVQAQKKTERMKHIQASQLAIKEVRLITEKNLPSRFAFWKNKNLKDLRNENVVRIASDVEKELDKMMREGKIDLQRLKILQKKVSPNRSSIDVDIAPTFQTITHHRAQ